MTITCCFLGPAASFTAHPYLHDKLPYDPRELSPVARISATRGQRSTFAAVDEAEYKSAE